MKAYKKILLVLFLAFPMIFMSCTDESELIVPQVETTDTTGAEGTGGKTVDPD